MKKIKLGLLPRVIIAIALGIALGNVLSLPVVRVFVTFNAVFSQFLNFVIPLIIIGLVTPAIADIGKGAGKLLLATVAIAYADTVLTGVLSYGVGTSLFPSMISSVSDFSSVVKPEGTAPYFEITIPPMADVMSALVFSFLMGLCIAYSNTPTLKNAFMELKEVITKTIAVAVVPLLPLFIFGIFLDMTMKGDAMRIMTVFAKIIVVIFALHIFVLLYQYVIAGAIVRRNPLRLLINMLPAYFTALGTSSSAATIPVSLRQTLKNGVRNDIASFVVPLCATIHMSGSTLKITACALTLCMLEGIPHSLPVFIQLHNDARHSDGGSSGSAGRKHHGGARTARLYTGVQHRAAGSDDCALHCHGQLRHGMQRYRRRSHSVGYRQDVQAEQKGSRNGCGQRTGGITEYI